MFYVSTINISTASWMRNKNVAVLHVKMWIIGREVSSSCWDNDSTRGRIIKIACILLIVTSPILNIDSNDVVGISYRLLLVVSGDVTDIVISVLIMSFMIITSNILIVIISVFDKLIWRTIGPKSFLFSTAQFSLWARWCS